MSQLNGRPPLGPPSFSPADVTAAPPSEAHGTAAPAIPAAAPDYELLARLLLPLILERIQREVEVRL